MSFDTIDEQTSLVSISLPFARLLPEPGLFTDSDLYHFGFLYAPPLAPGTPPPSPPIVPSRIRTRPPYPQPVLRQASTGYRFYLQVRNDGHLDGLVRTPDEPFDTPRLTLVAGDRLSSWELRVTDADPPGLIVFERPVGWGQYEDLSVWDWRGREYLLTIPSAGHIFLKPVGRDWPVMPTSGVPTSRPPTMRIIGQQGQEWEWTVSDGGIWYLSTPTSTAPTTHLSSFSLWTFDDQIPFTVSITRDGILTVIDADPDTTPHRYEVALVSPAGLTWLLRGQNVNGDVILELGDDMQGQGDEWPIMLAQNGRTAYIADDRYPPPIPGIPRRYGTRRRIPRA